MTRKSNTAKTTTKKKLPEFDKYDYYKRAVQSPDIDVRFFRKTYKELKGKTPESFREDFCGTFSLSCEWVKLDKNHTAIGVDLDPEPIEYGQKNYFPALKPDQQNRLQILRSNVLDPNLPKADIIGALNFSFYIFKTRHQMKQYFENCLRGLKKDGILILDAFGGSACQEANEEETLHDTFSYFWQQESFDPITHEAKFYIHFKRKGEKRREKVFTYDWRMWMIPELRELLDEVGFAKTHVYWEGTTEDGEGDGVFKRLEHGEECESWIAYIVAEK